MTGDRATRGLVAGDTSGGGVMTGDRATGGLVDSSSVTCECALSWW